MQGLPDAEIGAVVERMAPMLDILMNGSTDVNIGRAEQCGSGDWAYPSPRRRGESPWGRRPDVTTSDRIMQLLQMHDPVAASQDQLRLWWGFEPDAVLEPAARIVKRFPAAIREARASARRTDTPEAAESAGIALLERNVPSAFVAPLAVLISLDRVEGRASR